MASSSDREIILVTGAAGFIGSAIVSGLAGDGRFIRAGTHRALLPASIAQLKGVGTCVCDLDKPDTVRAAMAGVSLVVHVAYGRNAALAQQCRTLLGAMTAGNARSLIQVSSVAVYGQRAGHVDETAPPQGSLGAYGVAKFKCESLVNNWVGDPSRTRRRALVLRPGVVYGQGSRIWIEKMAERISCGAWCDFGRMGDGLAPLLHVDDLVGLVKAAANRISSDECASFPKYAVINVVGPETQTWNDYFAALTAALGAPRLPRATGGDIALRQALAVLAKLWRRFGLPGGRRASLAPTPSEIALFSRKATYATEAAVRLTGFAPRIGLEEGLARTLALPSLDETD